MYVRWQSYKRRSKPWEGREQRWVLHWRAILVESKRVDGKPRQIHVAYLAGFIRHNLRGSGRVWLWERIDRRLDKLGNRVSPDDRKRIVAALARKAGEPPTKAERIAAHRKSAKFFAENFGTDDSQYKAHRAALGALGVRPDKVRSQNQLEDG
jgi:hypothetical protein